MSEPELSIAASAIPGAKKCSVDVSVNNKEIVSKPTVDALYPTQRVSLGDFNFHDVKIRVIGNAELHLKLQIPSRRGPGHVSNISLSSLAGGSGLQPDGLYTFTATFNNLPPVPADKELTLGLFETRVATRLPILLGNAEKLKPSESLSFTKEFMVQHAVNEKQEFHFRVFAVTPGQAKIADKDCIALVILSMDQIHDAAFFQKEFKGVLLEDGQPLAANKAQRLSPPTLSLNCKRAPKTARTFGEETPRKDTARTASSNVSSPAEPLSARKTEQKSAEQDAQEAADRELAAKQKSIRDATAAAADAAKVEAEQQRAALAAEAEENAKQEAERKARDQREREEREEKERTAEEKRRARETEAAAIAKSYADKEAAESTATADAEAAAAQQAANAKAKQEAEAAAKEAADRQAKIEAEAAAAAAAAAVAAAEAKRKADAEAAEAAAAAAEEKRKAEAAAAEQKRKAEADAAAAAAAAEDKRQADLAAQQKRASEEAAASASASAAAAAAALAVSVAANEDPTDGEIIFQGFPIVQQPAHGVRYVIDVSAKNLVQNDLLSKADPIVAVFSGKQELLDHTETIDNEHNPVFRHPLYIVQHSALTDLTFLVYDVDGHIVTPEQLIGLAKIKASDLASAASNKSPLTLPLTHPSRAALDKKLRKKGTTLTLAVHVAAESEYDAAKSPVTGNAKLFFADGDQAFLQDISRFFGPARKPGAWPVETRPGYEYTVKVEANDLIKLDFLSASDPIAAIYEKRDGVYQLVDFTEWQADTHQPAWEKLIYLHRVPDTAQQFKINVYDADSEVLQEEDRIGSAEFTGEELEALKQQALILNLRHDTVKSRNKALTKKKSSVTITFVSIAGPFGAGSRSVAAPANGVTKPEAWASTVIGGATPAKPDHGHEPDTKAPQVVRAKSLLEAEIEKKVAAREEGQEKKRGATLDRDTAAEIARRVQEEEAIQAAKVAAQNTFKIQQRGEGQQMEITITAKSLPPCNPLVALYENVEGDALLLDQTEAVESKADPVFTKKLVAEYLIGAKQELTFVIYHTPDVESQTFDESDKIGSVAITYQQLFDKLGHEVILHLQNAEDRKLQNVLNKNHSTLTLRLLPIPTSKPSSPRVDVEDVKSAAAAATTTTPALAPKSAAAAPAPVTIPETPAAAASASSVADAASPTTEEEEGEEEETPSSAAQQQKKSGGGKNKKKKNKKRK